MRNKKRGLLVIFTFVISTVLISACTQSLSSAPVATPTLLPPELFVSPFPSAENPMAMIEEFAKQTAVAQTTVANGGTPVTPQPITVGTVITPQAGTSNRHTNSCCPSTPTNAVATTPVPVIPQVHQPLHLFPLAYALQAYTLQNGEFPYCIARRFNVDPDALLSASGLTSPDIYYAGLTLTIPQSGAFPGSPHVGVTPDYIHRCHRMKRSTA